jgi:hypothetical protein
MCLADPPARRPPSPNYDHEVLILTGPIFDGLYEYHRRAVLLGRPPA